MSERMGELMTSLSGMPCANLHSWRVFSKTSFTFIEDLLKVIPNSSFRKRGTFELKKIVAWAKEREFTSLIVINEDRGGGLRGVSMLFNPSPPHPLHFIFDCTHTHTLSLSLSL
jgi:hypothetical protein